MRMWFKPSVRTANPRCSPATTWSVRATQATRDQFAADCEEFGAGLNFSRSAPRSIDSPLVKAIRPCSKPPTWAGNTASRTCTLKMNRRTRPVRLKSVDWQQLSRVRWNLKFHAFAIPTEGNAADGLAAYAARGRAQAHIYMPADAPAANQVEARRLGAELHLVDGLASDAAKHGWFDVSAFKEPYGCEGYKTLGLELAESFGWELPDVIICPTGNGTGLGGECGVPGRTGKPAGLAHSARA